MSLDPNLEGRIESWTKSNQVFLFMKGTTQFPQCGFSAAVIDILEEYDISFETCNVLEDHAVREGIKEYSDWPTIPQLYVKGEFVGGSDIVREMHQNGELAQVLEVEQMAVQSPVIVLTQAAVDAFQEAEKEEEEYSHLRLQIDKQFQYALSFGPSLSGDVTAESSGFTIRMDRSSAKRADGLKIDLVSGPEGTGFKIDNPNEPPKVKEITVQELKEKIENNAIHLFDVRSPQEMDLAKIENARLLDEAGLAFLEGLDKDAAIAFLCHHGRRSLEASTSFIQKGFRDVSSVRGGIDAWSLEIDSSIPRY